MVTIMSDVKLPGIGNIPKPALIAVGAASIAIIGYAWYKHNGSAASSTPTTDPSAVDPSIDPATGIPYADEYGYMNSGYSYQGVTDPTTGQIIGSGVGTGVVTQASTNAAWAQAAQSYLVTYGGFQDAAAVAAALGAGLLGHYMTPDQVAIWSAATAFEGDPPQGHPPINTTPPPGNPPPVSLGAPTGIHVTNVGKTTATLAWTAVTGAQGYLVTAGGHSYDASGTSYGFHNLRSNTSYTATVQALAGGRAGPRGHSVSFKTSK